VGAGIFAFERVMRNHGHPADNWYALTAPNMTFANVTGDVDCDIAIIGGGFTGLGAALELAQSGANVALFEAAEIGSGASGRNGGQLHIGQRLDPAHIEALLGDVAAKALWQMAMDARENILKLVADHTIDCDLRHGIVHAWHRPKFEADDRSYADFVEGHYGYGRLRFMTKAETADELGTDVYHGALFDAGGGHLHPLKFALGMAKAAQRSGAKIFEQARIVSKHKTATGHQLALSSGHRVTCNTLLICGNGYMSGLDETIDAHVLPINNFILTTEPLHNETILRSNFAAADSRFVVNYWRKTHDNRLLFGGGENYSAHFPSDIKAFVRANMLKIYPDLREVKISHAWGGTLSITLSRAPFVRNLGGGAYVAAGYSGQGVVLAPYFGKLLAKAVMGDEADVDLLARLPTPSFWGGKLLRTSALTLGLSYYALLDKLA
jgi:gamma-glutamylputrescine oxidase